MEEEDFKRACATSSATTSAIPPARLPPTSCRIGITRRASQGDAQGLQGVLAKRKAQAVLLAEEAERAAKTAGRKLRSEAGFVYRTFAITFAKVTGEHEYTNTNEYTK